MQVSGRTKKTARAGGDISSGQPARDMQREAANALNFWQALEYIAPQEPPAVKLADCVWKLAANASPDAMPWADPKKIRVVNSKKWSHRRYQLFAGIIDGFYLIETARAILGAPLLDTSERKPPPPAACIVLNVDQGGLVVGEVFVSTLPWAMATLIAHRGKPGAINFKGFFGPEQHEEQVRKAIKDLMCERKLIADEALDNAQPRPPAESLEAQPLRPIAPEDLAAIADLVFHKCGWVPEVQEAFRVQAFRAANPANKKDPPLVEDPLNSFFAEDLERVSEALATGDIGAGLARYLAGTDAPGRIDLDSEVHELIKGVHPSLQPRGCWPSAHPLVTAQQFAVNTAVRELSAEDGIFAVNGPPGTGKTTMLKDIVAAVVVQRADVMAQFDNPADAFTGDVKIEDSDWPAAALDARLQGFGIVVSSANNGAVENISKDFPSLAAVAPGLDLDYFSVVADSAAMHEDAKRRDPVSSHWGLLTAVLGSKAKRNLFSQRFWFEGFAKKPKFGEAPEPIHPHRLRSLQEVVKTGDHGALQWPIARENYRAAKCKADELINRANTALAAAGRLAAAVAAEERAAIDLAVTQAAAPALLAEAEGTRLARDVMEATLRATQERQRLAESAASAANVADNAAVQLALLDGKRHPGALALAGAELRRAEQDKDDLRIDYDAHISKPPGFFAQLFRTSTCQRWNVRSEQLDISLDKARADARVAFSRLQQLELLESATREAADVLASSRQHLAQHQAAAAAGGVVPGDSALGLRDQCAALQGGLVEVVASLVAADTALAHNHEREGKMTQALTRARSRIGAVNAELARLGVTLDQLRQWDLSRLSRDALHSSAPYFTTELFEARRAVFSAAMALHKSFIVAAWQPLRKSLSAFVNVLTGAIHPDKVAGGVAQLWDAFFLVVPVVSTTFASFPRLFTGMRRESLAWLLIDEAGQAGPQQAVGAIWRARRTILVGDPRQLEPVVGVPEELIGPLRDRCGAEPQWAPPLASAQTLADRANRYGMHIGDEGERIWLGAPLLVHRRCLNPMFTIANCIAYNDKMVYGSGPDKGEEGIGPSRWIDIPAATAEGHWIPAQARHALTLVERITGGKLKRNDGQFKVYIVTPFRMVSEKIRELLAERYGNECKGMSGTVHTFQGKEAEHVIFLLGGDPQRPGVIANFAGKKPNLVNVAVTRAKRRLYVIGDRDYWTGTSDVHMIYHRMAAQLPVERLVQPSIEAASGTST
jgi:hypothetical protein